MLISEIIRILRSSDRTDTCTEAAVALLETLPVDQEMTMHSGLSGEHFRSIYSIRLRKRGNLERFLGSERLVSDFDSAGTMLLSSGAAEVNGTVVGVWLGEKGELVACLVG
jgi:hypothetical protein